MDFDDDIDACIDDELRILDEMEEENNSSQSVKRLHSPEDFSNKRLRTSSENEDIPTSVPGSLSFGHSEVKAANNNPVIEDGNIAPESSHNNVINQRAKPKDLLLAMDESLRKKEAAKLKATKKKKKPRRSHVVEPVENPPNPSSVSDNPPASSEITETSVLEVSKIEDEAILRDRRLKADGNIVKEMPVCRDYLSVTGGDGRRLYITRGERESDGSDLKKFSHRMSTGDHGVMSEDFYLLMDQAKKLLKRQQMLNKQGDSLFKFEVGNLQEDSLHSSEGDLWVNKYSPHSYIDLLSEENINRALLFWLKSWDRFVFGKSTLPDSRMKSNTNTNRFSNQNQSKSGQENKKKTYLTPAQLSVAVESDASRIDPADGRPIYKAALLCGPPGLGKTTLAHILAKHAGYRVLEMNASDDRSADAFRIRLDAAIGSRGAVGSDGKLSPICLIIDEIDGAPAPTIEVLVNAIKTPMTKHKSTEAKKNQKKNNQPILRPVICICNNLYSPALRNLRPVVLTVRFPEPELSRIASRLWSVTKLEGMKVDMAALTNLAEKSNRDIRSCLNTLQFVRTQGKKELRKRDLDDVCLGQKDTQRTLFTVWQDILSIPKPRQLSKSGHSTGADDVTDSTSSRGGTLRDRFEYIHQIVMAIGETEKIVKGLFENYLEMKFKDTFMHSIVLGCEWLQFYDRLQLLVGQHQDYSLLRYASYLPVLFHLIYATSSNAPKLQFPRTDMEAYQKKTQSLSVLDCVKSSPSWRSCDYSCLVMEGLPHLYDIIHPTSLKPMNTQLYSAKEKTQLANTVSIMIDSGLTFRQERSPEGEYVYRLEPDLDLVVRFPGASGQKGQLSYAARQMIAQEINLEKMRRLERTFRKEEDKSVLPSAASPKPPLSDSPKINGASPGFRAVSVQEQIRLTGQQTIRRKVLKDFFGRPIVEKTFDPDCSSSAANETKENKTPLNQKIWFKFKEGYSNAIRRPVKMRDLLM